MYLSVLMRNPNDAGLHLVSIFVQIHLTVTNGEFWGFRSKFTPAKNAHQMEFGIIGISYTKPLVESKQLRKKTLDAFATLAKKLGVGGPTTPEAKASLRAEAGFVPMFVSLGAV